MSFSIVSPMAEGSDIIGHLKSCPEVGHSADLYATGTRNFRVVGLGRACLVRAVWLHDQHLMVHTAPQN